MTYAEELRKRTVEINTGTHLTKADVKEFSEKVKLLEGYQKALDDVLKLAIDMDCSLEFIAKVEELR